MSFALFESSHLFLFCFQLIFSLPSVHLLDWRQPTMLKSTFTIMKTASEILLLQFGSGLFFKIYYNFIFILLFPKNKRTSVITHGGVKSESFVFVQYPTIQNNWNSKCFAHTASTMQRKSHTLHYYS